MEVYNIDKNNNLCNSCSLSHLSSIYYEIEGDKPEVMLLGINPGIEEIRKQRPFIGRSGKLLRELIMKYIDSYIISNAILCVTPNTSVPEFNENLYKHCNYWIDLYEEYKPNKLIALGRVAVNAVRYYYPKFNIPERMAYTQLHVFKSNGTTVYTLPHPSYILRTNQKKNYAVMIDKIFNKE